MRGDITMKRICLILIACVIICVFVSCNDSNSAKFIDFDTIIYNGAIYHKVPDNYPQSLYYSEDIRGFGLMQPGYEPKYIGSHWFKGSIWIPWEDVFGDNILRVYSPFEHIVDYYKEGFDLSPYNELSLDKILLYDDLDMKVIIEFDADKEITWDDILDYGTIAKSNLGNLKDSNYWVYGQTREYSNAFYTGLFTAMILDDVVYLRTDPQAINVHYKIVDEYQEAFKNAIIKANE